MTIETIYGKVACLLSGDKHRGSAWLISKEYALTAGHCIFDNENGVEYEELRISLPNHTSLVTVSIEKYDEVHDLALLKIMGDQKNDLEQWVIDFSHTTILQNDEVYMVGYPGVDHEKFPNGYPLEAKVVNPEIQGPTSVRIHMSYHGGSIPDLKGMSGCAVTLNCERNYAVGLLIETRMKAHNPHAISIVEIFQVFPELQAIWEASSHVDNRSPRLCIDIIDDGYIRWSAPVKPEEAAKLWEDSIQQLSISCMAPLTALGVAGDALKRLFCHGQFRGVSCPGAENQIKALENQFFALEGCVSENSQWNDIPSGSLSQHDAADLPAEPVTLTCELLADLINKSLDLFMLDKLHLEIENCNTCGYQGRLVGCNVEISLWRSMFSRWRCWHEILKQDPTLCRQFLAQCLMAKATVVTEHYDLVMLGAKTNIHRLFKPTITALALAASNVVIEPFVARCGNLRVDGKAGHACGLEHLSNEKSILKAASHLWTSEVVILPYLQKKYMELWRRQQPINRAHKITPNLADPGLPPLVVSNDIEWEEALESGSTAVKSYYKDRKDEILELASQQQLRPRDEGMRDVY